MAETTIEIETETDTRGEGPAPIVAAHGSEDGGAESATSSHGAADHSPT